MTDGNKPEEIDKAMKICTNFPMGPLALIDLAGADIVLASLESMEKGPGPHFHPSPLLRQMVRAGHIGRKMGVGFYRVKGEGRNGDDTSVTFLESSRTSLEMVVYDLETLS